MDDSQKYYWALGEFIETYSRAETVAQIVLWSSGSIPPLIARAIFSGTKVKGCISYIRRIHQALELKIPQEIDDAFNQLTEINNARDNIVHYGSTTTEDGLRKISNSFIAHHKRTLKEFPISPDELNKMRIDLITIMARLLTHFYGRPDETTDKEWSLMLENGKAPFLYKSPLQGSKGQQSHSSAQTQ